MSKALRWPAYHEDAAFKMTAYSLESPSTGGHFLLNGSQSCYPICSVAFLGYACLLPLLPCAAIQGPVDIRCWSFNFEGPP